MSTFVVVGFSLLSMHITGAFSKGCILDVGFLFDGSKAKTLNEWISFKSFLKMYAHRVGFQQNWTRIGLVTYGDYVSVKVQLDKFNNVTDFKKSFDHIDHKYEHRHLSAGLRTLRNNLFVKSKGDRPEVPNVVIVLTAGTEKWKTDEDILQEAKRLKRAGVTVFAVGFGPNVREGELSPIVSRPFHDYVLMANGYSDRKSLVRALVNATCKHQNATYTLYKKLLSSGSTNNVTNSIDLVFLLDSSSSTPSREWPKFQKYIKLLERPINIKGNNSRVAVIQYSGDATLSISLGEYKNQTFFDHAVDRLRILKGKTNLPEAIDTAYRHIQYESSSRSGNRKVVVLMTPVGCRNSCTEAGAVARTAKSFGISIFVIGIGERISIDNLMEISSKPFSYFIHLIANYSALPKSVVRHRSYILADTYPDEDVKPSFEDCAANVLIISTLYPPTAFPIRSALVQLWISLRSIEQNKVWLHDPQSHKESLHEELKTVPKAFAKSIEADGTNAQNIIVIVSNHGIANVDLVETEVGELKKKGFRFIVMIIGKAAGQRTFRVIASEPKNETFLEIDSAENLRRKLDFYRNYKSLRLFPIIENTCKMSATLVWSCSFEKNEEEKCSIEDDLRTEFTWTRTNLPTPSHHTGPSAAYNGFYYTYTEATKPRKYGDRAIMFLPYFNRGMYCLSFYYHMYGSGMGVLDIFIVSNKEELLVWRTSGSKGNRWQFGEVLLRIDQYDRVGVRGIRGKTYTSDIGLDMLRLRLGPCVSDM